MERSRLAESHACAECFDQTQQLQAGKPQNHHGSGGGCLAPRAGDPAAFNPNAIAALLPGAAVGRECGW